jgi:DNA-binding IscR family transcriptional regulator
MTTRQLLAQLPGVTEEQVDEALSGLRGAHFVLKADEKGWALARDLREVKLSDLYRSGAYVLPDDRQLSEISGDLKDLIEELNRTLRQTMDQSIAELLNEPDTKRDSLQSIKYS